MIASPQKSTGSGSTDYKPRLQNRYKLDAVFMTLALIATLSGMVVLLTLLVGVLVQGLPTLSFEFLTSPPSRDPSRAGIWPAFLGTLILLVITAVVSIPLGIGSGIFLQEFAKENKIAKVIEVNISNLAAVPSIIYGLLGLSLFARVLLPLTGGRSILSGGLTLSLLILPVIIVATREALKAVPDSLRQAGMALGSTRWQTVRIQILPLAIPGIMTGTILSLSRAIGEAAPLIVVGAAAFVPFPPTLTIEGLREPAFTALPIQIFNWVGRPQAAFQNIAASGIIVLLIVLLVMNASAIYIRNRFQSSR